MAVSKVFSIRNFAIKQLMKTSDDGIMRMPSNMKADFAEAMLTKQLIDAGIDPRTIKNEQQMINVLDGIDNMKKQMAEMATKEKTGITSAKIMDMEGKEIPKGSKIMGGKAVDDDLPPPGSRGGKDDIAAPVQSSEETIKNMIEAENKKNIAKIKNRKMIEEAIDNVSIGFSGDRRTDAELVAAEIAERRGLNIDDLDTRQRASIYGEAYEALTNFLRKDKADGGMLVQPSMTGKRPGYRGDAAAKSSGAKSQGRVGGSDVGESSTKSDPRDDGPDDRGNRQQNRNQKNIVNRSTQPKESILKKLYDTGQELTYFKNLATGNFPGLTKQLLFDLGKRKLLDPAANTLFPEGDLQEIKKNAPDQTTYNIQATKDMVGNLPGGLLKDIVAPAGALVMSPFYDAGQAITRMEPGSGITGFMKAFDAENPISSAAERFTGASAALAERLGVANGGRIGLKDGMDRRTFMKILGGLATLPILGKFFKGAKVASKAAPVAEKMVGTSTEAPTYFLKLVDKITKQGKPTTSTEDIMETYIYTAKNGDTYELVNDLKTGDLRITKDKTGVGSYGDKTFDTIEDRTVMEYRAPKKDVDVEARKGTEEPGEYEEFKVEFDADGTEADATDVSELVQKEIIEESAEEAPSIKKADGGRVGLLSGGGILRTIIMNLAKEKGINPSEYLKITNYKALPNEAKRIMSKEEFLKLKSDLTEKRVEMMENIRDMITTRQNFEKSKADLAAGMNQASPGYGDKAVEMMFPPGSFKSPVPAGSGQKDVIMMEQLIKNLKTKDRQLNASGGVAYMLGE